METANFDTAFSEQNKNVFLNYDELLTNREVGLLSTRGVAALHKDNEDKFYKLIYKACSLPESQYTKHFTWADFEFEGEMYFVCLKFTDKNEPDTYVELVEEEDLINPDKRKITIMLGLLSED